MTQGFWGNLGNALSTAGNNFKTSFANTGKNMSTVGNRINNALYGTPTYDYGSRNQAYLDKLRGRQDFQDLAKAQNMSIDEALKGVMQGLNYGSEKIADEQTALGIRKPNANQVDLAREGLFNQYGMRREGGFVNDHPVATALGAGLLGAGMGYLGNKLNETDRFNRIASRYYGDRYTPVLPTPDEQWGSRMTQGIQGILMGNTGEPVEFQ